MRLELGYPDPEAERELLMNNNQRSKLSGIRQLLSATDIKQVAELIDQVHATDTLLDYVQRIIAYTRQDANFSFGLSPRGAMALMRSAKTWALLHGRNHVTPEDVQTVLSAVVDHRLRGNNDASGRSEDAYSQFLLGEVDIFPS